MYRISEVKDGKRQLVTRTEMDQAGQITRGKRPVEFNYLQAAELFVQRMRERNPGNEYEIVNTTTVLIAE